MQRRREKMRNWSMIGMKNFILIPVTMFDEYGNGEVATFGQLPYSKVYHGLCTVSTVGDIPKVDLSYLENISEPAEIISIKGCRKV